LSPRKSRIRGSAIEIRPVEELPHPVAAQRHLGADRHPFADLEACDRLAGAADLRALPRDDRQLLGGRVELLRVVLRLADAMLSVIFWSRGTFIIEMSSSSFSCARSSLLYCSFRRGL
jgi:hypothetical protein